MGVVQGVGADTDFDGHIRVTEHRFRLTTTRVLLGQRPERVAAGAARAATDITGPAKKKNDTSPGSMPRSILRTQAKITKGFFSYFVHAISD